jgi:amino acid transporter
MTTVDSGSSGAGGAVDSKGLKGGSLGLLSSVVVGMASTAPAYSLAAVLGLIVATGAGVKAVSVVLLAFVPIYLIAVAYQELNKAEPDCGTTFTWASRAFGPLVGWMGGWGIIAADVIVMANLAQIAGAYSFTFMGDLGWTSAADLANSTLWSTVAGVIWIIVMTYICYRGIEVSARLQYFLLGFEVLVLVVISVYALIRVYSGSGTADSMHPSLSWFSPAGLDFGTVICPGILIAIFIYWGWDTAVACNEESDDPGSTPGKAAVLSTFLLLGTYAIVTVAAIAFAGVGDTGPGLTNPDNAADVFSAIGPALFGDSFIGHVGLLALSATILTSASASTQTTILPTARTTLSMGVYKALPTSFAKIHRRYLTPTVSTLVMGAVSIFFYVLFTLISSSLLLALIGSVGLMIAFYYGMTGYACVWYYRKTLTRSARDVVMRGVVPLLGAIMLTVVFVYGLISYAKPDYLVDDVTGENVTILGFGAVAVVGIGALVLGVILMFVWWAMSPSFFKGQTLPRRSDLLLEPAVGSVARFGLPDSGEMPTVISQDLSNLPRGERAVDPATGEEFTKG